MGIARLAGLIALLLPSPPASGFGGRRWKPAAEVHQPGTAKGAHPQMSARPNWLSGRPPKYAAS